MKITVVVDSIDRNDSSGSKANVALIQNLAACGFEVLVLHYTRKEIKIANTTCIAVKEKKSSLFYLLSRTERIFTRITKISLNRFLESQFGFSFTFFNDVNSIKGAIKKAINFHPDLVITLSKGASFRPHYAILQLPELHNKWLAYIHDPFPFHFYPRPYNWVQPGYAQKEAFFAEVAEKAKFSAFPSQLLKDWMGSYFPNFLKTGKVIPHQLVEILTDDVDLPSYFDKSKFSVLHAGNLMKQRSPLALIKGYKKFLEHYPEATETTQLLLLGPASYYEKELQKYKDKIPTLVVENRNVPFIEVVALQKQVAVNVILESKSEISPFLPGKFPHCIEANKPILLLSPYYSECKRLLGENYPYYTEVDDVEKIAVLIQKLYELWKQTEGNMRLNRNDLMVYLSQENLKSVINQFNLA